jgi:hypothetical protein
MNDGQLKGLREIGREHPRVKRSVVVRLDPPARTFAERLRGDALIER